MRKEKGVFDWQIAFVYPNYIMSTSESSSRDGKMKEGGLVGNLIKERAPNHMCTALPAQICSIDCKVLAPSWFQTCLFAWNLDGVIGNQQPRKVGVQRTETTLLGQVVGNPESAAFISYFFATLLKTAGVNRIRFQCVPVAWFPRRQQPHAGTGQKTHLF